MTPSGHVAASVLAGVLLAGATGSPASAVACVIGGVLIDADHIHNYALEYGWRLRWSEFKRRCMRVELRKAYLLFHSWELTAALLVWALWAGAPPVLTGLAIGVAVHMLIDQAVNPLRSPWGYFLLYRAGIGFDAGRVIDRAAACRRYP